MQYEELKLSSLLFFLRHFAILGFRKQRQKNSRVSETRFNGRAN